MSDTLASRTAIGARLRRVNLNTVMIEGRALIALAIIVVTFSLMTPNFLQPDNLLIMTRHVAMNAILALGMLMVILNGGIDLSVGSTVGFTGVIAGYLLRGFDVPLIEMVAYPAVWVVVLIACLAGLLVGYVNGIVVSRFRVAPFIATLGMLYVARGFALLITDGETFTDLFGRPELGNTGFVSVLAGRPLGIPMPVWVMVAVAAAFSLLLTRTPFGRWLYASGSNSRAAELSGVPVRRVQTRIYMLSGLCAGIVGVLLTADLPAATPRAGEFYELNAIAAVVIGGATLSGGRGTVRGTLIGAFVIGFLVDGLVLVGVSVFWQQVIKGAVIILAVAIDQMQQNLQRRRGTTTKAQGPAQTPGPDSLPGPRRGELAAQRSAPQ